MVTSSPHLTTIDDVILALEAIITANREGEDTLGYFAVLYHRVTRKVQEGIANDFFDDGPRMERLDVAFAKRYIDAYHAYRKGRPVTQSWERAFAQSGKYWPIVLQHLLLGMNAHINLDLGIAAAEISKGQPITALRDDFRKINTILASLVDEMQQNLARIWPRLTRILQWTGHVDNALIDFSMEIARDGAWRHARQLAALPAAEWPAYIEQRDAKVARKTGLVLPRAWLLVAGLGLVRLGERGTVLQKMDDLGL